MRSRVTNLTHSIVILDQGINSLDRQEALLHGAILGIRVKDIRGNHGGKIVDIHFASRILINM